MVLKGNPGKIICPDDGQNRFQRSLNVGEKVWSQTLTSALNNTIMDVITSFKEFPKVADENTVYTVTYIIRKIRDYEAMQNPSSLRQSHFKNLLQELGNNLSFLELPNYLNINNELKC